MKNNKYYQKTLATLLGDMVAIANDNALCFLDFADCAKQKQKIERLQAKTNSSIIIESNFIIDSIEQELNQYFAGAVKEFKTPLVFNGSAFQQRVWQELKKIPYGKTASYSYLAARIGKPSAFRAVGNANGSNQCVIIIPCHRVINENGNMGGYNSGLERKRWLLDHEKKILEEEAWLFLPENKEILARIKKSLAEEATIDLGLFKKYLKNS